MAATRPKPSAAAAPRIPGPGVRSGAGHTFIISSRCENHTADKVVSKLNEVGRARNHLECHPVLEVTTELYKCLTKAGYVYVELQQRPVWDQFPFTYCSRCLSYEHSKHFCKEVSENVQHKWDDIARLKVATSVLDSHNRIAGGRSTEECTDHVSLRFIQFNLQRSKVATTELLVEAERRK
ncbi:hypothetical protein EVAR_7749_1 [Eumeta japonica]|uniref:Uncharacterized protein n=1 Tax=Eumeta variegata TaxID=151549 RepID=A0A4C1TLZ7_EUMVA|nr:hypothetical protein EVAR_7749_1 [Eumeta japonica]